MQRAIEIVQRYHDNNNQFPRMLTVKDTPQNLQEFKDAQKLKHWNKYLKKQKGGNILPDKVRQYLDSEMPGWRDPRRVDDAQHTPMQKALVIENRYRARGFVLPKESDKKGHDMSQDPRDASRLRHWRKYAEQGKAHDEVLEALMYLDTKMPGWRGSITSINGSDMSRKRARSSVTDPDAMFRAIIEEREDIARGAMEKEGMRTRTGNVVDMDRETFCKWFVRFIGEARRRLRLAGAKEDDCCKAEAAGGSASRRSAVQGGSSSSSSVDSVLDQAASLSEPRTIVSANRRKSKPRVDKRKSSNKPSTSIAKRGKRS